MTEWWTYRPSDFVMVAPRTYWGLMETHNAAAWPLQLVALGLGALALQALLRRRSSLPLGLAAAAWLAVAQWFHLARYADIHTAAPAFAGAAGAQALLLLVLATTRPVVRPGRLAWGLMGLALAYPAVGLLAGQPLAQAEWAGLSPDPTALFSLGLLAGLRPGAGRSGRWALALCWPWPLAWCLGSGLTLWNLQAAQAWVLPLAAGLAALAALRRRD